MVNRNAMSHITSETFSASAMLLSDDEIKVVIKHAFKPFRCVVEILPDRQMRFQVIKQKRTTPNLYRARHSY